MFLANFTQMPVKIIYPRVPGFRFRMPQNHQCLHVFIFRVQMLSPAWSLIESRERFPVAGVNVAATDNHTNFLTGKNFRVVPDGGDNGGG